MHKYADSGNSTSPCNQRQRIVSVGSLGGTISSVDFGSGMLPVEDLLDKALRLSDQLTVRAKTIALLESSEVGFQILIDFLKWAEGEINKGADGAVLIQGTDTLEESAFFLDLLWDKPQPLIVTGAMRTASDIGSDGFKNLRDALFLAANPDARGRGVLVVLNDEIHEARLVCKRRSTGVGAFESASLGVCGSIRGPYVRFSRGAPERLVVPVPKTFEKRVGVLQASMDGSPDLIESMLSRRYDGLVIAGFGVGHVPNSWHPAIEAAAAEIPVLIASRVTESFSYPDDGWLSAWGARKGEIHFSGLLDATKSRILLMLLIEADLLRRESVREKLRRMFMFA